VEGGNRADGVFAAQQARVDLTDVKILSILSTGVAFGLDLTQMRSVKLLRVDAEAHGYDRAAGILLSQSSATIRDSYLRGFSGLGYGHGLDTDNSSSELREVDVHGSVIVGEENTVFRGYAVNIRIAHSQLSGGSPGDFGSPIGALTCYGVYDENFNNAGGINACP
jgi:hypothetical protein